MSAWHRGPMLAFDTETTGPNPDTARIVSATVVEIEGSRTEIANWLIAPEIPIPAGATAIHGITTEHALAHGAAPFMAVGEIVRTIEDWLRAGLPMVGMNICYDLTVLDRECRRQGIDTLSARIDVVGPIVDVFVLDKHIDQYRKGKRTLTAMAATYGLHLDDAHDALADALTAARIAWKMAEALPQVLQVDPMALHERQIGWRYEQCRSLQAYFNKQGIDELVNTDWPIQALPFGWDRDQVDKPETAGATR